METKSSLLLISEAARRTFPDLTTMFLSKCDYYDLKLQKLMILKHHHSHAQLTD